MVDRRRGRPGAGARPVFPALPALSRSAREVPVVTRYDYATTGFSAAHLGDSELHGWHTVAGLVTSVRALVGKGERFVYAYYEGIDKVAHARGLGEYYDDELRDVDRLVGDLLGVLPPGAVLVVTADHGQVAVGPSVEVLGGDVMDGVTLISGEGRFRWLHTRPGATAAVAEAAREAFSDVAWVRTRDEMVEEGWMGGVPSTTVSARLGDVVLAPFTRDRLPRPRRHGRAAAVGPPWLPHGRGDADSPAQLALHVTRGLPVAVSGDA